MKNEFRKFLKFQPAQGFIRKKPQRYLIWNVLGVFKGIITYSFKKKHRTADAYLHNFPVFYKKKRGFPPLLLFSAKKQKTKNTT